MRWGIYALILLALAGCGDETNGEAASSQSSDSDHAATLLLLGGSFLNGWNQGRDQEQERMRQSTCQWLAGMLQCTSW